MSFILDALKKSESDRQRQNGPALYEVKVAAPRTQLPLWAIGLAVLLGVNLVIVAWALLKRPSHPAGSDSAGVPMVASQPPQAPMTAAAGATAQTPVLQQTPAGAQTVPAPATTSGPPAPIQSAAVGQSPAPPTAPSVAARNDAAQQNNPDDYAPATEASQPPSTGFHARMGTESGVPLYSQMTAADGGALPQLRLDLHAYAAKPEDRFVLINMKKLREGDSLAEGVKVESITPDGVVLSHNGSKFLLPRE